MKRLIAFLFITFTPALLNAGLLNKVVATVGNYPITSYDVDRMEEFLKVMGGDNSNRSVKAFEELLFFYSLKQIVDGDKRIILPQDEIDRMIDSMTNIKEVDNTNEIAKQRLKVYEEYPEEFKLQLRKSQIVRALIFYDTRLKDVANEKISEDEIKDFYEKNKDVFVDQPKLDLVVIVCKQPKDASLDELEKIENRLGLIANSLKKSNDVDGVLNKYKGVLNYESFSGRTGLKSVYELYSSGIPEELLAFSLSTKPIPTTKGVIKVDKGFVIGPEITRFRNLDGTYYFVLKVIDRRLKEAIPLDKVRPLIVSQLREKRLYDALKSMILEKVKNNEIQISLFDDKYKGEYDEFLRG